MKLTELMRDTHFIADLINGPCKPKNENHPFIPVNPDWIDETASCEVTEAFSKLLPPGIPYLPYIIVENNPDTLYDGACVDENGKRQRYFEVTLIPDTDFPYNFSFPLIHQMWIVSLSCWDIIRATLHACTKDMHVLLANDPKPPILNNAMIEWVSLYLGREPYKGLLRLSEQWAKSEEFDGIEGDVRLFKVREMEKDALLQRLIDAYDIDFLESQQ